MKLKNFLLILNDYVITSHLCKTTLQLKLPRPSFTSHALNFKFYSHSVLTSLNYVNWMNINNNYRIILHPFWVPIICFPDVSCEWWDVHDALCDKSNQWTKRSTQTTDLGMKRIFGHEINELIMRQTMAKLAVLRTRNVCNTEHVNVTTKPQSHVEDSNW